MRCEIWYRAHWHEKAEFVLILDSSTLSVILPPVWWIWEILTTSILNIFTFLHIYMYILYLERPWGSSTPPEISLVSPLLVHRAFVTLTKMCHPTVSGRHLGRLKSAFCFPVHFNDVCSGKDKDTGILSAFSQRDLRGEGRRFRALMSSPCSWEPRVSFIFVCSESGTLNLQHAHTVSNLYTLLRFVVREGT